MGCVADGHFYENEPFWGAAMSVDKELVSYSTKAVGLSEPWLWGILLGCVISKGNDGIFLPAAKTDLCQPVKKFYRSY